MGGRAVVAGALLGVAVAGGALLATGEESPVGADRTQAKVKAIASQVEELRGLKFGRLPEVRRVSAAQLRKEIAQQQRELSGEDRARLQADSELLKLLGFIDRNADLASATPDTSGIAGTYEFDSKRLTIVRDVARSEVPPELVYAHELAHALEDQRFGLDDPQAKGDDAAQAYRALAEGSATFLEARYAKRHLGGDVTSRQIAKSAPASTEKASSSGRAYGENADRFAYLDGARFVARLHRHGGWKLVNRALTERPPRTTEEILHPDAYLEPEAQSPVELQAGRVLGRGYRRLSAGQLGEFDTAQMLLLGAKADDDLTRKDAATAAEGWDGGRYELWQARRGRRCSQPCVERDALVLAWAWDSSEEVAEFVALLPGYLERFQKLRPAGPGAWRGDVAAAALAVTGRSTTLAIAPDLRLARRLARTARARP